ncbi:uncharacterized protein LTHEOB_5060 [Lasiodiplodia theobromae]|uniref:uncharacterized protein n=1 Tax=Lasiodiplodia theobromae TaxID=45133 RepID=UPI0015C3E63B|nr:uncharacterized protein LTHEOB_5060 [Lasiodiplodia theobromae]KAF4545801.1 hypothetical protein LTHEOB_5060 [Lasiodiplodia theobromae]
MRFINNGPVLSAFDLWSGGHWYRNSLIYTLLILLVCTTSISQFTSTLLLWDIENGNVLGFPVEKDLDAGFSMNDYMEHFRTLLTQAPNYWASTPSTYNTFAEWSISADALSDNAVDTGPTIRALLPITSDNDLLELEEYNGTASLFDARVSCVRPTIKDAAFNFDLQVLENFTGTLFPGSVPEVIERNSVLMLFWTRSPGENQTSSNRSGGFDIVEKGPWLEYTIRDTGDTWSVSACFDALYGQNFYFRPWHDQDFRISAKRESKTRSRLDPAPKWDTILNQFDTKELRNQLGSSLEEKASRDILIMDYESIQAAKEARMSSWSPERNCTFRPATHGIWWYPNTSWPDLPPADSNTDCQQLNASTRIKHDFLHESIWTHFSNPYSLVGLGTNSTYSPTASSAEMGFTSSTLHPILTALAIDILAETDNPALAWQAIFTCVIRNAYYDISSYFTARERVTTTSLLSPQRPVRYRGLGIVLVNIVLHHVLVLVMLYWFCAGTRYTLLGNCWQSIAQLRAAEMEDVFGNMTLETDKDVKRRIRRSEGTSKGLRFRVMPQAGSDRVCLCRVGG